MAAMPIVKSYNLRRLRGFKLDHIIKRCPHRACCRMNAENGRWQRDAAAALLLNSLDCCIKCCNAHHRVNTHVLQNRLVFHVLDRVPCLLGDSRQSLIEMVL